MNVNLPPLLRGGAVCSYPIGSWHLVQRNTYCRSKLPSSLESVHPHTVGSPGLGLEMHLFCKYGPEYAAHPREGQNPGTEEPANGPWVAELIAPAGHCTPRQTRHKCNSMCRVEPLETVVPVVACPAGACRLAAVQALGNVETMAACRSHKFAPIRSIHHGCRPVQASFLDTRDTPFPIGGAWHYDACTIQQSNSKACCGTGSHYPGKVA